MIVTGSLGNNAVGGALQLDRDVIRWRNAMAKALMGHLVSDRQLAVQVVALKARVSALEAELEELRSQRTVELPDSGKFADSLDSELADLERATPALA